MRLGGKRNRKTKARMPSLPGDVLLKSPLCCAVHGIHLVPSLHTEPEEVGFPPPPPSSLLSPEPFPATSPFTHSPISSWPSIVSLHTAQSIRDLTPRNTSPGSICSHLDKCLINTLLSSRAHVCITPVLSMKPWMNEAMDQWVGCLPLGICSDPPEMGIFSELP